MRTNATRPGQKSTATLTLVPRPRAALSIVPPPRDERPEPLLRPGVERWLLLLHREEGPQPRRPRERSSMFVALRDLAW